MDPTDGPTPNDKAVVPRDQPADAVPVAAAVAGALDGAIVAGTAQVLVPNTAPPPVAAQSSSHVNAVKLQSEKVVVGAPLSYAGSAARIWKLTGVTDQPAARIGLGAVAVLLIVCAWMVVTSWYLVFGLLLVPYRLIRRGQRKRKRQALQHRETIAAITRHDD
jgi:hypothetical protein